MRAGARRQGRAPEFEGGNGPLPGPPPLRRSELGILYELEEPLGLTLWQAVRHVHDWADTPPVRKAALFHARPSRARAERDVEAKTQAPELSAPLQVFTAMTSSPERTSPDQVAEACHQVAEWAQGRGFPETAVVFGDAAAVVQPRSPQWSRLAGRVSRTAGFPERAELWYQRAVDLARGQKAWKEYVRAHLGLGRLYFLRGETELARRHYLRAARAARSSSGEKWLAAETEHDLMALAAEQGDFAAAEEHARKALAWYPKHHARFPAAVHDFAFLLVRQQLHSLALPLLEAVVAAPIPPQDRVIGWSTVARAAGGAGERGRFQKAKERVLALAPTYGLFAAAARVNLALGARALEEWDEAEAHAVAGVEAAIAAGQHGVERAGRELLAEIRERKPAPHEVPAREAAAGDALVRMAEALAPRLAVWRGRTWTRRAQAGPGRLGQV